jgi:peptidoglycan hydrolase-like protein with peptidoglycan-binding domain
MVEFCTRDTVTDEVLIHVIEGNNPSAVARNTYNLNSQSILGYGTVHDVADITMAFGNQGEKVRQLQEKLAYLGFLDPSLVSGRYGDSTVDAIRDYQTYAGLRQNGIANINTQLKLNEEYAARYQNDPAIWTVTDED